MSSYFVDKSECTQKDIFPGVTISTCACEKMMLSFCEFQPGAVVAEHSHPHEQVGIVVEGRARFFIGDEERELGPGDMFKIPGGVLHRVVALGETFRALDVFHPVREEYV